jgi:hypothetical protein
MISKADIAGHWVHSHEEDDEKGMAYRPAKHKLPRARGRTEFEFNRDGTCRYIAIGRGDRPDPVTGTWTLDDGKQPRIRMSFDSGETMDLRVVSVSEDKLVLKSE